MRADRRDQLLGGSSLVMGRCTWNLIAGSIRSRDSASAVMAVVASIILAAPARAGEVTYTGWAMTDVSLGGTLYKQARVTLTFRGETADVHAFDVPASGNAVEGCGWQIKAGTATVTIEKVRMRKTATFSPNQIAVAVDTCNSGMGFVSYFPDGHLEPGYPLVFDGLSDTPGDLTSTGTWSGHAWSCVGFPPQALQSQGGSGLCNDPLPLKTSSGDFLIFQPYNFFFDGALFDDYGGSLNIGFFATNLE